MTSAAAILIWVVPTLQCRSTAPCALPAAPALPPFWPPELPALPALPPEPPLPFPPALQLAAQASPHNVCPLGQAHALALQMRPLVQALLQSPQCAEFELRSTHCPEQDVMALEQALLPPMFAAPAPGAPPLPSALAPPAWLPWRLGALVPHPQSAASVTPNTKPKNRIVLRRALHVRRPEQAESAGTTRHGGERAVRNERLGGEPKPGSLASDPFASGGSSRCRG